MVTMLHYSSDVMSVSVLVLNFGTISGTFVRSRERRVTDAFVFLPLNCSWGVVAACRLHCSADDELRRPQGCTLLLAIGSRR
jgi:hypothetical protein